MIHWQWNFANIFQEEDATVNGFVYIVDFAGVSPGVVPYLERRQSKLTADVVQVGKNIAHKFNKKVNLVWGYESET